MMISNYMKDEHRVCDTLFAKAEEAVSLNEWGVAIKEFEIFAHETLLHFKKEEEELFPAFERQTNNTQGPTMVMKYEHDQIRNLIEKMGEALESQDQDTYLSLAESMMILVQQHNMKEEQMLYAMCDNMIPSEIKETTLEAMKKLEL